MPRKSSPPDPHDHLRRADPKLAALIDKHGPSPLPQRASSPQTTALHYEGLVRAIVSQQLSGKAADTIFARVIALGNGSLPSPHILTQLPDDALRKAGLSGAKTKSIKDLATRIQNGSIALDSIHAHDDESVIQQLTQVKGIGRWTAEMFLMFRLGRLDILSTADLGLRKGMMHLFQLSDLPDPKRMEELAAVWRPYRSVASWYLWRAAEAAPPLRSKSPNVSAKKSTKKKAAKKKAAKKQAPYTKTPKRSP